MYSESETRSYIEADLESEIKMYMKKTPVGPLWKRLYLCHLPSSRIIFYFIAPGGEQSRHTWLQNEKLREFIFPDLFRL